MSEPTSFHQVTEGTTTILVPRQQTAAKGPGKKQGRPFYNPAMELNRDFSISVAQWLLSTSKKKHLTLLDGLAATGIRGIRFAHELQGFFDVTINDWSVEAYKVIKKNVKRELFKNIHCTNLNINQVVLQQNYDYIDVDPFGSPVSFIDAAIQSIRHHGVLAVSATDTATLCGVYPTVCKRRYAATPFHGPVMHEVGLRILLGYVAREAAKHDKGIVPIFSYKTDHYMRLYVHINKNIVSANKTIDQIQTLSSSKLFPFQQEKEKIIGPLWTGQLHSKQIVTQISRIVLEKEFGTKKRMMKLLSLFLEESEAPPFYYTTNDLASLLHCSPPRLNHLCNVFQQQDIPIFKTQFDPTGFKTQASFQQVKTLFLESCNIK